MVATKIRGSWWVSFRFKHADGRVERVRKKANVNTRAGADAYERKLREAMQAGAVARVPTLAAFVPEYLKHSETTNRPSYARQKAGTLRRHLLPVFGARTLDEIDARAIAAYRAARARAGAALARAR